MGIIDDVVNLGIGTKQKRRFGKPRTDAERRKRHKKLHGTSNLPKRGTGLRKRN